MFSDTIKLADINDYITPEVECVIETGKKTLKLGDDDLQDDLSNTNGSVTLRKTNNKKSTNSIPTHFNQMEMDTENNRARITLNDCLACSGCITSAETVLIQVCTILLS